MDMLIGNGTVITLGENNRIIPRGAVLIKGNTIADIGTTSRLTRRGGYKTYVDARGMLIMPGMINCHMHLYSTFARGLSPKPPPPRTFVQILERMWWPLDLALNEEDILYSALIPLIACIKNGTTMVIDHHESQGFQMGSLKLLAKALKKTGVRGSLCLGISDRYGKGEEGVEENVEFIEKVENKKDDMVTALFGLHAAFTVKNGTLQKAVEEADRLGVGFHTHCAEDKADETQSMARYKMRVVNRLYEFGVLGPKSIAVHCVHIDKREMELLRKTGTAVVHNPQSNMNNAVGVAPVLEMMKRGITVGLGTDGMTTRMFDEVRVANILHKLANKDPRVAFAESCEMLLGNNAAIVNRYLSKPVGVLEKGALADIIVVDYVPPTPLNTDTFLGHFLFGICEAHVDSTIINGKILMKNGKLTMLNEQEIAKKSRKLAKAFWSRF